MTTLLPLQSTTGGVINLGIRVRGSMYDAFFALRKALETDALPEGELAEGQSFTVHLERMSVVEVFEGTEEEPEEEQEGVTAGT